MILLLALIQKMSVLKLTVSTTKTVYKPPLLMEFLYLEPMYLSVTTMDSMNHSRLAF